MSASPTNLFLLQDLEDPAKTMKLAHSDLTALLAVAQWIRTFVARPQTDVGRPGPVCPFVPRACECRTLWLASERIAHRSVADLVELVYDYRSLLTRDDDSNYEAIVIVLSDLSPERAADLLADRQIAAVKRLTYEKDGIVMGEFHRLNEGAAIRNPHFQPFKAPVPFLLMRHAVVDDWMFFLDDESWFQLWAHRYGESAALALAERLRRSNWRMIDT